MNIEQKLKRIRQRYVVGNWAYWIGLTSILVALCLDAWQFSWGNPLFMVFVTIGVVCILSSIIISMSIAEDFDKIEKHRDETKDNS